MCSPTSFTCVKKDGLIRKSFVIPPVGSVPAKRITSISPSQCVGIE